MRPERGMQSRIIAAGIGLLLALCLAASPVQAQQLFSDNDDVPAVTATFEADISPRAARPGEHVRLLITAAMAPGWYIYSVVPQGELAPPPTRITTDPAGLAPEGPVYETNPTQKVDKVFGLPLAFHPRAARFYQNLRVPDDAGPGRRTVSTTVRYQTCNDRICLPPRNETLQAALTIEDGPPREPYSYLLRTIDYIDRNGTIRTNPDSLEGVLAGGLPMFLLLAAGFGLLALLTPCVFPMIPVTVSFFAGVAGREHGRTLPLALLFGTGMVATYTGLGLALTGLLGATGVGRFATSPWVNLLVALFFILFALSLLGMYEVAAPAGLTNRLERWSRTLKGPGGVLLMGVAFTATSFTCTMPFVGTLLVAATQGHLVWPLVGMLVFATVFAVPFVLLALFPGMVTRLRGRSGNWLVQVKVVLGLLELMAALKFISNADVIWGWGLFDRELLLALWAGLGLATALVVLGRLPWPGVNIARRHGGRIAVGGAFALLAAYFAWGLTGRELDNYTESYLPPAVPAQAAAVGSTLATKDGAGVPQAVHELPWHPSLAAGLAAARETGKPLFVDFTGYTCVNCRWMEKEVFARKPVLAALRDRFVLAQLYTDGGPHAEENQRVQIERFRTLALPYYVVLSPDNAVLATHAGIMADHAEFLDWLTGGARQLAVRGPHDAPAR